MKLLSKHQIFEGGLYPEAFISFGEIVSSNNGSIQGSYFVIRFPTWIKEAYYNHESNSSLYGRRWYLFTRNSYKLTACNKAKKGTYRTVRWLVSHSKQN